jgi:ATPase subunit of ABC transporter with duplicated ATPase domains
MRVCRRDAEPDADFDKLAAEQAKLERSKWRGRPGTEIAADALRPPPWEEKVEVPGGEKRRVALCWLLSRPDLLPLDEPTNHPTRRA